MPNTTFITPKAVALLLLSIAATQVSAHTSNNTTLNSAILATSAIDNTISLEQVTKDVTFLASDELKGRGNFTPEINESATYIASRLNDIGLTSPLNTTNYLQNYRIEKITPENIAVTINNQVIAVEQVAMVTNQMTLSWSNNNQDSPVIKHVITESENMRDALQAINLQGGEHLVLLHPSHEKIFKRYQRYFSNGVVKLTEDKSPASSKNRKPASLVVILSDTKDINSFSIEGTTTKKVTNLSNVIGVLPGKSKANEIVLYTAHYDHLGEQEPEHTTKINTEKNTKTTAGSKIFNGADDDASGVSAIINLANHFSKIGNNERTLMFVAFSAEEIGGFGSRYFSQQLDPKSITAMVNIEMIGKPAKFGSGTVWMTGIERSSLGEQLNHALEKHQLTIYADPYPEQNLFYRSDNATLAKLGVPAHSFSSTQLDKDQHYHQVTDDINSLDLNSLHQVIKTLAIATTPLVTGEVTPSRIDPSLVKNNGLIY